MKIPCLVTKVSLWRRRTYGNIRLSRCEAGKNWLFWKFDFLGQLLFQKFDLWNWNLIILQLHRISFVFLIDTLSFTQYYPQSSVDKRFLKLFINFVNYSFKIVFTSRSVARSYRGVGSAGVDFLLFRIMVSLFYLP